MYVYNFIRNNIFVLNLASLWFGARDSTFCFLVQLFKKNMTLRQIIYFTKMYPEIERYSKYFFDLDFQVI